MTGTFLQRALRDGVILGLVFLAVVVASLYVDPALRLDHYPPEMRQAYASAEGASARDAARLATALGGLLVSIVIGGAYLLARRLPTRNRSGLDVSRRIVHAWLVMWIVNLVDVLVVDGVLIALWQPEFVILPGTSGMSGYGDWLFGLRTSLAAPEPWIASLVVAVPLGLAAHVFARQRGERMAAPAL